ncbi:hypothetical protein BJ944DRAFT_262524 [Cunninghamella echinulata]|nr:hypothetical protein BJ944DRAFT_262524 [Cunninghamella echinulata]
MSADNRLFQQTSGYLPNSYNNKLQEETLYDEDEEDNGDRKRSRMNNLQLCDTKYWMRRNCQNTYCTPVERVRKVIDIVVDNGYEQVDLSHCELTEIPDEIVELQYITVFRKDIVKTASLQLYLFANQLETLSPTLFQLKNLTVLSLRRNRLTVLPGEIALLENLVELSIGNNALTYLPAELQLLPKLILLSVSPNPLLTATSVTPTSFSANLISSPPPPSAHLCHRFPSLFELASRQLLTIKIPTLHHMTNKPSYFTSTEVSCTVYEQFKSIPVMNRCYHCRQPFIVPTITEIIWKDVVNIKKIPLLYRFCSIHCHQQQQLLF